jgi:hypothetical protein
MLFDGAATIAQARDRMCDRNVPTSRPRLVMECGERKALKPGNPGHF